MTHELGESVIAIEQNPNNGKWDVGWKWENGDFAPYECGLTKAAAEHIAANFEAIYAADEAKRHQARGALAAIDRTVSTSASGSPQ
jgi:hypothetical protein